MTIPTRTASVAALPDAPHERGPIGSSAPPDPRRRAVIRTLAELALPAILIALLIGFSLARPEVFPTVANIRGILLVQSVLAILAIGVMFPLIVGHFDLSIGGNLGLGAILVTGLPSLQGLELLPSIVIALIACTLVGLLNGILVMVVKLNSFISTLAVGLILAGLTDWYTGSQILFQGIPTELPQFGKDRLFEIPFPVLLVVVVTLVAWFFLKYTPAGRYLYAIGGSPEAARLSGVRVTRLGIGAFVISGFLAGVAGVLESAVIGTGNPTVGASFLLPAFAAVFLGATTIRVGQFNPIGTIIAVLTIAVGVAGLQLVGLPFYIEPIFNGCILIIAVLATRMLRRNSL
jgi:ribose transport system permease protein